MNSSSLAWESVFSTTWANFSKAICRYMGGWITGEWTHKWAEERITELVCRRQYWMNYFKVCGCQCTAPTLALEESEPSFVSCVYTRKQPSHTRPSSRLCSCTCPMYQSESCRMQWLHLLLSTEWHKKYKHWADKWKCLMKRRGFKGERINQVYEPYIFIAPAN